MSRRRRDQLYTGAKGRTTLAAAAQLGAGWVVQPKLDGAFGILTTDGAGRLGSILTRSGEPLPASLAANFRGIRWAPGCVLHVELETHTEAADRFAARRGYRCAWAFDALRVGGRDLAGLSYEERRDALRRAEALVRDADRDRPWTEDATGRAHDSRTGHFLRRVPRSWRRLQVVPQLPAAAAERAWGAWVDAGELDAPVEGLVLIGEGARVGARAAKRKIKPRLTIDAVVLQLGRRRAVVHWTAGEQTFTVGVPAGVALELGAVVELVCEGFYERTGLPKFARLARRRQDLERRAAA